MKIEMHAHCQPISRCAHHEPELLPAFFHEKGIGAIVLTNHCYPHHCDPLSPDPAEQARIYVDVYHRCKAAGEPLGVKVFFGAEVKLINEPNYPEFLLYGLSEKDFLESYPLYTRTQEELFDFCNQKNIVMVQAHPYRTEQGYAPADMRYVHGIEVYNPHPCFDSRIADALRLAEENGKLMTSGSDFHVNMQAGVAGMIVPDDIGDQFMLRDYLRTGEAVIFDQNGVMDLDSVRSKA